MNRGAFGLEADEAFGEFAFAGADFCSVDLGGNRGALANDFCCIPLTDWFGGFIAGFDIVFTFALSPGNEEQFAVPFVHALNFDAIGPHADDALLRMSDVHQSAAI